MSVLTRETAVLAKGFTGPRTYLVLKEAAAGYAEFYSRNRYTYPGGIPSFYNTVDEAINNCVASRGDRVVVCANHAEPITGATDLVADVAGVTFEGQGRGLSRPTFTFTTAATASIPVSGASNRFENMRFIASFADITTAFTPTATDLIVDGCDFEASAADVNFLALFDTSTTDNQVDGLTLMNSKWIEPDAATLYVVKGDADIDQLTIKNNYINLGVNASDLPALVNMATGKDITNVRIEDNDVVRLNDANPLLAVTDTTTANTGVMKGNFVRHLDTAAELLITAGTNIGMFGNYATAAVDASAYLLPAADS